MKILTRREPRGVERDIESVAWGFEETAFVGSENNNTETHVLKNSESIMANNYSLTCNDCQVTVRIASERELKPEEQTELQARMLCHLCLKKMLDAKNK